MTRKFAICTAFGFCLLAPAMQACALAVTQPTVSTIVAAGDDYATQVLGQAWDMSDPVDIDTQESCGVNSQAFGSGLFSGITSAADANIYPLFEGYLSSINLSRGANFPIDTSHYRYLTMKIKATQPAGSMEFSRIVFFQVNGTYGLGVYHTLPNNAWFTFTNDMLTQIDGTSPHQWTDFPQVTGIRIDPATPSPVPSPFVGSQFSLDWVRLTAPATVAQTTAVQWTDSGYSGTYLIAAIDAGGTGTSYTLAASVSGTSYQADTSFLAPGQYQIRVTRTIGGTAANSATFLINSPPQITISAPSVRGDQTRDFATIVAGNAWGPISAIDFSNIINFSSIVYNNPANSFYGRPTNNDPQWLLNLHGQPIDTSIYRSLCLKQEVFGQRSVLNGSVARLFWGNSTGALTTSQDIVLDDNLNDTVVGEYCVADLAAAPLEGNPNGGAWSGTKSVLRLDPHEFTPPGGCNTADTCHDVRLDSVILSPFAQANPGYTFTWTFTDTDNAGDTVDVYLDPETTPGNGNEKLIGSAVPASGGQYVWPGSNSVNYGTYHALVVATDGKNIVDQYGGGVIIVGARDGIFRNGFDPLP
jgi:hypothetical protein